MDKNGIITYGDFHDACIRDPNMLESLGPCLPTVKQLRAFLLIFADDYNVFTTNFSNPNDIGWDRERDKFARRAEINANLRWQDRLESEAPLLSFRDRQNNVKDVMGKPRKRLFSTAVKQKFPTGNTRLG